VDVLIHGFAVLKGLPLIYIYNNLNMSLFGTDYRGSVLTTGGINGICEISRKFLVFPQIMQI
jgi:hypothetical protein